MCGYVCTGFIDFMLKGKSLLEYTNLFPPNDYEKNDKIIFLLTEKMKNHIALSAVIIEKSLVLSIKCKDEDENYLNKKNQWRYLKFLV